jgi:ParB-like chromosome segregation protein Spo0J
MTTRYTFHPACELFPLIGDGELKELADNIKKEGQIAPVVRDKDGLILDGRNRLRACDMIGVAPIFWTYEGNDPVGFIIAANIHRRHLNAAQKRGLIAKLLKAQPEKSDRQIAKQTKSSPTSVGKARKKLEKSGDVSTMDTRKDTKGRQQPAQKAKAKKSVSPKDPPKQSPSELALAQFKYACDHWLSKLDADDRKKARTVFETALLRVSGSAEVPEDVRRAEMEMLA